MLFVATAPFLYEFESLGSEPDTPIRFVSVVRLERFRRERWVWAFALMFFMIAIIFLAPLVTGRSDRASRGMLLSVVGVQVALWSYAYALVVWSRRRRKRR